MLYTAGNLITIIYQGFNYTRTVLGLNKYINAYILLHVIQVVVIFLHFVFGIKNKYAPDFYYVCSRYKFLTNTIGEAGCRPCFNFCVVVVAEGNLIIFFSRHAWPMPM